MKNNKRIGLALSGGGYRAAGFHLGTLKKLDELGVLKCIDVMSTISGGSITGAAYCLHQGSFKTFEEKMVTALTRKSVIRYILTSWIFLRALVCCLLFITASFALLLNRHTFLFILPIILLLILILFFQFKIFPVSKCIIKAYDQFFFEGKKLSDLCPQPELVIGSTNLQTMRPFTFSKDKMGDSTYAHFRKPILFNAAQLPISTAVMASTCVPFAFTPVTIDKAFFQHPADAARINPMLVDGGVYDNQGIHKLTQQNSSYACDRVIVSDAGNKLPFEGKYNNTFSLLLRTMETFMARIKNFQMVQQVYQHKSDKEIVYYSLGWDIEHCLSGFVDNMHSGNVASNILQQHQLNDTWITRPQDHKEEIIQYLSSRCKLKEIQAGSLSQSSLKKIRSISTNLTPIPPKLLTDMMIHAGNLTEIQIRLYCPSLLD